MKPLTFYDAKHGQMQMAEWGSSGEVWLSHKHPDGQWVSFRRATEDDYLRLIEAMYDGLKWRGHVIHAERKGFQGTAHASDDFLSCDHKACQEARIPYVGQLGYSFREHLASMEPS